MFLHIDCVYFLESGGRNASELFVSIFKLFRKKNGEQGCLKTRIHMFAYAHFIPPCTPFYFKATEREVAHQLNSNGDAIKCKKAEGECNYGYALQPSYFKDL